MLYNIGHRGARYLAPENTIASFRKAMECGAHGFELDVQLSKDGEPVVIHDETLSRTTNGTGYVKDYNLIELKQLTAGAWFSDDFTKETIPSLSDVIDNFSKENVFINIELKNNILPYPGLEELVIETIKKYHMEDQVIISSFNYISLKKCNQINPEIRLGLLSKNNADYINSLGILLNCDTIHTDISDDNHISRLPKPVICWNINDIPTMRRLLTKVYGIITDYPELLSRNNY